MQGAEAEVSLFLNDARNVEFTNRNWRPRSKNTRLPWIIKRRRYAEILHCSAYKLDGF